MSFVPSRPVPPRNQILRRLSQTFHALAEQWGLDTSFVLIITLVAAYILITFLIALLVWLRYLVTAGLVTTSVVTGLRWRRDVQGVMANNIDEVTSSDGHGLEVDDLD
jgi:uncharacterized membrane protein (DUF4010 family)